MNTKLEYALKIGIPIVILASAGAATALIIQSREGAKKSTEKAQRAAVVRVAEATSTTLSVDVEARGEVIPIEEVTLRPRVTGEIDYVWDELEPGALVDKGQLLARVDRTNYTLNKRQREAQLAQAKAQLKQEKGRQEVAATEWRKFSDRIPESVKNNSLALREPQLESAKASVALQEAILERAEEDLSRTAIRAPMDGMIREDFVAEGDVVSTQSQIATMVATDAFWVRAFIPVDELPLVAIPNINADEGSMATIVQRLGERTIERTGRVERLFGGLDADSRMARVLIRVEDPLSLGAEGTRGIPLLLDSFVEVSIDAKTSEQYVVVPQEAIHDGDEVWIYEDGTLTIQKVEVARHRPDDALISSGLEASQRVVVSGLAAPRDGMKVALPDDEDDSDEEDATNG